MSYKPSGHSSVSPYLVVDDAAATLDFVSAVFGTEPGRVMRGDDGAIMHAEIAIDDSVVMVGQMAGGPDSHVHVYVPNADDAFGRAVAAGGTVVESPADQPYGDRRSAVRDQNGTTWWISTQLATE